VPGREARVAARLLSAATVLVSLSGLARADVPYQTFVAEPAATDPFDGTGSASKVGDALPSGAVPVDAGELIDGLPGVNLQRTNRGAATPIIRGLVGIENVLTLDGVRLNLSTWRTGPNQYAALFDPLMFESVGVELGPSGVRHGAGALGGVIALSTHDFSLAGASRLGAEVIASGASADASGVGHARVRYGSGAFDGWAAATVRGAGDLRQGGGEHTLPGAYQAASWGTKNRLKLGSSLRLQLGFFGMTLQGAKRTDQLAKGSMREADNLDQIGYLRLDYRDVSGAPGFVEAAQLTLSFRQTQESERQARCRRDDAGAVLDASACGRFGEDAVTSTDRWRDGVVALALDGSATGSLLDRRLSLELFGGLRREWIASGRPGRPDATPQFSDGSTYDGANVGLWATADMLRRGRGDGWVLRLDGGVRVESMRAFAPDVPGLGVVDVAFSGIGAGARAVAVYDDIIAIHAGWTRGFRAPNLQESTVIGDTGQTFEIPNPDLGPQVAEGLEFGLRFRSRGLDPAFKLGIVAFSTVVRCAIVRVPATLDGLSEIDGKEVGQRINAEKGSYEGVELQGRFSDRGSYGGLGLDWSISFIDGQITTRKGQTEPARRLPPINGLVGLSWSSPSSRWRLGARARWSAAQRVLAPGDKTDLRICADPAAPYALQGNCTGTDAWVDVGLWAAIQATDGLGVSLQLDNLFDSLYRVHGSGLNAPGFNARLGVSWKI